MTIFHYSVSKFSYPIFLVLFALLNLNNLAFANDDEAIKKAFLSLDHFSIEDGDSPWRISLGTSGDDALTHKGIIEGISTSHGEVRLSKSQRAHLYSNWKKSPEQLWLLVYELSFQVKPIRTADHFEIQFIKSESEVERKMREEHDKAEVASKTPLPASAYTQEHFTAQPSKSDYKNWQNRFKQDIAKFEANMRKDHDFGRKLFEDKNPDALKLSYAQSIDIGRKGLSLREELISAYYAPPGHEGTEVTPSGYVITQLLLSDNANPVGYGGTFIDEGNTVELWYMEFDDMSGWTLQDFKDSFNFKAFSPAVLPPYKTIKRNNWPALVFTRGSDGKIQLYGMSMELARILGTIYNAQLF